MPATVRILAALDAKRRTELETVLAVLHARGYAITVLPDMDAHQPPTGLGWRVTVDAPGYHAVTRLRPDATPAEWASTLAALTRTS